MNRNILFQISPIRRWILAIFITSAWTSLFAQNTTFGSGAGTHGSNNSNFGGYAGSLAGGNTTTNIGFATQYNESGSYQDLNYGNDNVNLGAFAGYRYSGFNNTFVGFNAGAELWTSSYNTYLGAYSGYGIAHAKKPNVFLGYNAGRGFTFSQDVNASYFILNNQASVNKPLMYGGFYDTSDDIVQIGIGTSNLGPATLTIAGDATVNGRIILSESPFALDSYENAFLYKDGTTFGFFSLVDNVGLPRVVADQQTGNMGIGTFPNASDRLSIAGDLTLYNTYYNWAVWDKVTISENDQTTRIVADGDENGFMVKSNGSKKISLLASNITLGTSNVDPKGVLTMKGPTVLKYATIQSDPRLDKYQLYVEKGIMAEDFALSSVANWPDYVFSKQYKLMNLIALEEYLKIYNHLPGVSSATTVKANGVEVSEVTTTLVKKVEELTLYKIEQHERSAKQTARIEALKKMIASINN